MSVPDWDDAIHSEVIDELREAIEAAKAAPTYQRDVWCPAHEDYGGSRSLSVGKGKDGRVLLDCKSGCTRTDKGLRDVLASAGYTMSDLFSTIPDALPLPNVAVKEYSPSAPLPSAEQLQAWHRALLDDAVNLRFLQKKRGLSLDTIESAWLGYDRRRRAFVIPVFDYLQEELVFGRREVTAELGELVNIRFYDPRPPPGKPKMRGLRGRGTQLFMFDDEVRKRKEVLLCEGELDALKARQEGFPAISTTGGARTWKWSERFAGMVVNIAYDCDEKGREGAKRIATGLLDVGTVKGVRVVDLDLPQVEDTTDWFVRHGRTAGALRKRIEAAPLQKPSRPQRLVDGATFVFSLPERTPVVGARMSESFGPKTKASCSPVRRVSVRRPLLSS
jgi:hypothetical protein